MISHQIAKAQEIRRVKLLIWISIILLDLLEEKRSFRSEWNNCIFQFHSCSYASYFSFINYNLVK